MLAVIYYSYRNYILVTVYFLADLRRNTSELGVFDYESPLFEFCERKEKWTDDINTNYPHTTKEARARAGFEPADGCPPMLQCPYCAIKVNEPPSNSGLIQTHTTMSPDCVYIQSEINYEPKRPNYATPEARELSFSENERFGRIRAGFQNARVNQLLPLLVQDGFYFASQVNVFDQVKCYFCDATLLCDEFGYWFIYYTLFLTFWCFTLGCSSLGVHFISLKLS